MKGFVTISKIRLADGRELSTQAAVDYGWICPTPGRQPAGWGLEKHEVPVGLNLVVDQGRQCAAFVMGSKSPISDYTIAKFGVGTGLTAAKVTDVALEAAVALGLSTTKAIDFVDFVSPFGLRAVFTVGLAEANGYMLSEIGLFSGNDTLIARKVRAVSINKTSDFAPTLTWRIRF